VGALLQYDQAALIFWRENAGSAKLYVRRFGEDKDHAASSLERNAGVGREEEKDGVKWIGLIMKLDQRSGACQYEKNYFCGGRQQHKLVYGEKHVKGAVQGYDDAFGCEYVRYA